MLKNDKKLIEIENGNLFFKKFHALKNINLEINIGDKISIIGHNGAGKSTLIDVLTKVKKLSEGRVTYFNDKFFDVTKNMGVQFQTKSFPKGLKFKSLLNFYLSVYKISKDDNRMLSLLKTFGVDDLKNNILSNMSGGQQQKVNIVLALLNEPKIIFIDEILSSLDISSQDDVLKHIIAFVKENKDLTVISVSHNEKEINALSKKIIVMKNGEILKIFTKEQIIKKYDSISNYMSLI